jgi:hypothetical protein
MTLCLFIGGAGKLNRGQGFMMESTFSTTPLIIEKLRKGQFKKGAPKLSKVRQQATKIHCVMPQFMVYESCPIEDYSRLKLVRLSSIYHYTLDNIVAPSMEQLQSYYNCNGHNHSGIKIGLL